MTEKKNPAIYLGGGGGAEDSAALDAMFFRKLPSDGTVLYVPLALDSANFPGALEWFTGIVRRYSPTLNIEMLTEENVDTMDFNKYDAIYIGGGNVFKLLDFVIIRNIGQKLRDFIKSGKAVYGGSAGAIILGKSINTASEMDDRGDYKHDAGLDLFKGACIACHWPQTYEHVKKFSIENNCKVYCIPETCGLIFDADGNLVETVGNGVEVL
jgi:dipeptidase E